MEKEFVMKQKDIHNLIIDFRIAIEKTCDAGLLKRDIAFRSFPRGCCGDTSELLAEYLRINGIKTIYVCGDEQGQLHAWLVLKDYRVKEPQKKFMELPSNIIKIYNSYSADTYKGPIDVTRYEESDLIDGLIIDITGDQFGEEPIYFGYMDAYHRKYEFVQAHDSQRLTDGRLCEIYRKIIKNI